MAILKVLCSTSEEWIVFPNPFFVSNGAFMVDGSINLHAFSSTDCDILLDKKNAVYLDILSNATKMRYCITPLFKSNYLISIEPKKVIAV